MKTSALILLLAVSFLQIFKSQCAFAGSGANSDDEDEYNEDYVEDGGTPSKLFCNTQHDCHNPGKLCHNYIEACHCINNECCDPYGYGSNCRDVYAPDVSLESIDQTIDSSTEEPPCGAYEENSPLCNGGTYDCGLCHCSADKFGPNCECDADSLPFGGDITDGCRPDPNNQTLCNNRGDCVCGKCECYATNVEGGYISGDFCECDNFSCDRNDEGLLCSGPDHGRCVCGKCACYSEWDVEGYSACECRNSEETCITPYGEHIGKMCSGHGTCSCGECVCTKNEEGEYSGTYCEECPNCPGQ